MKILFFSRLFYPHIGGVEKHVYELSQRLIKKGHTIIVVTENFDGQQKDYELYQGISIYRIQVKNEKQKKWTIWKWLFNHKILIAQADIIHCHDVFFWYLPFRFLFPPKKVFTTFHGYEGIFPPAKKAILLRKVSEKLSFGNICVGDYLRKWYKTNPTFVIYGAINKLPIRQAIHKKIHIPIKIAFLGRLEKDTGVSLYIKALDELNKNKVNYFFEVFGDGSMKKQILQYGKVHGFIKNANESIRNTDILFASSYLSSMEAFYQKKLVISTYDNPLKKDILTMTPWSQWIVATDDPKTVASTIITFMQKPEYYKKNIENSYEWVCKQTWDSVVDIYLKLWSQNYK
jgi:glycosyltransferase involved in cell wall biosynthesis